MRFVHIFKVLLTKLTKRTRFPVKYYDNKNAVYTTLACM